MDIVSIAMALAQFAPSLVKWLSGSDKAEEVAQKAVDVAMEVTGASSGIQALETLRGNPDLIIQYRLAVLKQENEFNALAVKNAADINATMQAEAAADHWPTYTWRPFIGFCFGVHVLSYVILPLAGKGVPTLPSEMYITIGAILGIASWYRGKMQADPRVPTDNRG